MKLDLKPLISQSALAFRGYNVTNLGRTAEMLAHPAYGPVIQAYLEEASEICADTTHQRVDLVARVREGRETELEDYAEAISLILAVEHAQLQLLNEFFGVDYRNARISMGFSLGEISALVAGGTFTMRDALQVPLAMSKDCVELAHDVTMGIVFSKGETIPMDQVKSLCLRINAEGKGVIGVSTILSPNSFLILGSQDTVTRFREQMHELMPKRLHLRLNENRWPPLHTPLVWQRCIPNRASAMLHTIPGGMKKPKPEILSLVTGAVSYDDYNARELIALWIDHPQRLWDGVYELLQMGIETVIHLGPEPNIVPATFQRLASNVETQTRGSRAIRAVSVVARRVWLKNLLPRRTALLRAPLIRHVILENWLLDQTGK
jgi:[acyl-carrier-protein] S-malonyltransferase